MVDRLEGVDVVDGELEQVEVAGRPAGRIDDVQAGQPSLAHPMECLRDRRASVDRRRRKHHVARRASLDGMSEVGDAGDIGDARQERLGHHARDDALGKPKDGQHADDRSIWADHADQPRFGLRGGATHHGQELVVGADEEGLDLEKGLAGFDGCLPGELDLLGQPVRSSSAATTDDAGTAPFDSLAFTPEV
jgi:hypothetical protein